MADKYLNLTVLNYFYNRLKTVFTDKAEFSALSDKVDEVIAEGGEPNVIDTVKVNGVALTPDNKAVDVPVPIITLDSGFAKFERMPGDDYAFSIEQYYDEDYDAYNVAMGGADGMDATLASTTYVQAYVQGAGGKIDVIKVNGTTQPITNKEVDITVITETQVQALIDSELADITGIDYQVVDTLPATGVKGTIYLVHKSGAGDDIYDEYVWVEPAGGTPHYEKIGTTDIDLSGYWSTSDLVAITTAEIDEMMA